MRTDELTDGQFREARRQIVQHLRMQAELSTEAAARAIVSACESFQNEPTGMERGPVERARALRIAAGIIEGMEREGFDWSRGMD